MGARTQEADCTLAAQLLLIHRNHQLDQEDYWGWSPPSIQYPLRTVV